MKVGMAIRVPRDDSFDLDTTKRRQMPAILKRSWKPSVSKEKIDNQFFHLVSTEGLSFDAWFFLGSEIM